MGAAVYLTEYASNRRLIEVIEFTNETLAGIPSIIYGLVGMLVFSQALGFQTCLLSGSLTLVVMNLPTIIRTTQESLKTVPQGYREGAMGLGAGKWHIIRTIVLPCSIDGIVTGCILAVGRIVGESAALLFTAGAAEVIAKSVFKAYTSNGATLSVLLYLRAFEDGDFTSAWGIGAVLLVLVLLINLAARLAKIKLKQKAVKNKEVLYGKHECAGHFGKRPEPLVRRLQGAERHLAGRGRAGDHRAHRPFRLRQVHLSALPEPAGDPPPPALSSSKAWRWTKRTSTPCARRWAWCSSTSTSSPT